MAIRFANNVPPEKLSRNKAAIKAILEKKLVTAKRPAIVKPVESSTSRPVTAKQTGRPKSDKPKAHLTCRIEADTMAALQALGPAWRTEVDRLLRLALFL